MGRQTPNLKTKDLVILDGAETPYDFTADFIMNLTASGDLSIRIGDGDKSRFNDGDKYRLSNEDGSFKQVTLINETGSDVNVTIALGVGDVDTATVISGAIKVRNDDSPNDELQIKTKSGTTLKVDDDATQAALASLLAILQNADDKRAALTSLDGCTFAEAINTTNTVVTAVANTDGIIIPRGYAQLYNQQGFGSAVLMDDNPIIGTDDMSSASNGTNALNDREKDLHIGAGSKLSLESNDGRYPAWVWYRTL